MVRMVAFLIATVDDAPVCAEAVVRRMAVAEIKEKSAQIAWR
jgi:hypothetical protein